MCHWWGSQCLFVLHFLNTYPNYCPCYYFYQGTCMQPENRAPKDKEILIFVCTKKTPNNDVTSQRWIVLICAQAQGDIWNWVGGAEALLRAARQLLGSLATSWHVKRAKKKTYCAQKLSNCPKSEGQTPPPPHLLRLFICAGQSAKPIFVASQHCLASFCKQI